MNTESKELIYMLELDVAKETLTLRYPNQRIYKAIDINTGNDSLFWESKDDSLNDIGNFAFKMNPENGTVMPTSEITHSNDWVAVTVAIERFYEELYYYG